MSEKNGGKTMSDEPNQRRESESTSDVKEAVETLNTEVAELWNHVTDLESVTDDEEALMKLRDVHYQLMFIMSHLVAIPSSLRDQLYQMHITLRSVDK